jgi:hypothetical protein
MSRLWLTTIVLVMAVVALFSGCSKEYPEDREYDSFEANEDYIWTNTDIVNINLNGSSVTIDGGGVETDGSKITIVQGGTYRLSGTLNDGRVKVSAGNDAIVRLILDSADIKCSDSSPIFVSKALKVIIITADNTENFLTDGSLYTFDDAAETEPDAPLYSKSYLSFYGTGSLTVKGNYGDGIVCKDGMVIKSGTITVTSTDDGIRGKDYIIVHDGNITINAGGDGIKSDNENDTSLGFITVDNGEFNITTNAGDAINAFNDLSIADGVFEITTGGGAVISTGTGDGGNPWSPPGGSQGGYSGTISEKGLKATGDITITKGTFHINTLDDAIHSGSHILINDGAISAASGDDGVHADGSFTINGGTLDISMCYEGIEGPLLTVNGGNVSLISVDDGFNATKGMATEANDGSYLYINGGNIGVNSSRGDGLDSNGNVSLKTGTVVIHGPQSSPEVGFDINGAFDISGGFFVATGPNSGNMIEVPSSSSSQYSVKVTVSSTLSASTLFNIQDSNGENIITFKPVRSVYYLVVSSPDLKSGSTYNIYTGGSSTGTEINGLYTGGTYSGGTLRKSFTISSKITNVLF